MHYVGFDPGGTQAFGWALFDPDAPTGAWLATGTCSNAAEAMSAAARVRNAPPAAVGVDAPLFWRDQGDRNADAFVRKLVCANGGASGTVGHVNSLRGACLVQGVLVARAAVAAWPGVALTEAHPKALLRIDTASRCFVDRLSTAVSNEHERDAALAAYTAWKFSTRAADWRNLAELDDAAHHPVGVTAAYWFPRAES